MADWTEKDIQKLAASSPHAAKQLEAQGVTMGDPPTPIREPLPERYKVPRAYVPASQRRSPNKFLFLVGWIIIAVGFIIGAVGGLLNTFGDWLFDMGRSIRDYAEHK